MKDSQIDAVLRRLEELERSWSVELTDAEARLHSFGRVPEDGNEIKLWSVPPSTGKLLECWVVIEGARTVLELGCSAGYSTLYLARGACANAGHVFTTEILPAKIELARKTFSEARITDTVTLFEADIANVLANWPPQQQIDFVFMDADKERYRTYYEQIFPLLREGGMIVSDNAGNYGHLMADFLETVNADTRAVSHLLEIDNGLLVVRKKAR